MIIVSASALLLASCSALNGPDWMWGEARSPDGRQVARLWCEHSCDNHGKTVLTVSPTDRAVPLRPSESGFPPSGDLPELDRFGYYLSRHAENAEWAVEWRDASTVVVSGRCLEPEQQPVSGSIAVMLQEAAEPGGCPPLRGPST